MSVLRIRTAACALFALLAQSILAPLALADDFMTALDTQPRVMLYASKSFGDSRELRSAPQLGLSLERAIDMGQSRTNQSRYQWGLGQNAEPKVAIVDLRWTKGYGNSVRVMNQPVYLSPMQLNSNEDSSGEDSMSGSEESFGSGTPYGKAAWITVGLLAAMCATNTVICEKDEDGNYTVPTVDPSTRNPQSADD